jgi:hypothetical protein
MSTAGETEKTSRRPCTASSDTERSQSLIALVDPNGGKAAGLEEGADVEVNFARLLAGFTM